MKLATRITLPITLTALAITGCSGSDTETTAPSPVASSSATPETTTTPRDTASATTAPAEAATTGVTLDTSSRPWDTTTQDPALLAAHGLISDVYYTVKGDTRGWGGTMCAQSRPTLCTEWPDREALMDEALGMDDPVEEVDPDATADVAGPTITNGNNVPAESAPLREQDPYAGLSDDELAELPVTGMP